MFPAWCTHAYDLSNDADESRGPVAYHRAVDRTPLSRGAKYNPV